MRHAPVAGRGEVLGATDPGDGFGNGPVDARVFPQAEPEISEARGPGSESAYFGHGTTSIGK